MQQAIDNLEWCANSAQHDLVEFEHRFANAAQELFKLQKEILERRNLIIDYEKAIVVLKASQTPQENASG